MIEIYAIKEIQKIETMKFEKLLLNKERSNRIIKWEIARRSLIADILIRTIICKKLKIEAKLISISRNKYGKPYLCNNKAFHFNISHSGDWIVCTIDESTIGIDIEMIKSIDLDIAKYFFSIKEQKFLLMKKNQKDFRFFMSYGH